MNATRILNEVKNIIKSIEIELNSLDTETNKIINNNVYSLGIHYLTLKDTEKNGQKFYAFVIKKSFGLFNYGHKIKLELMSFDNTDNTNNAINKNFKIDNYKLYKNKENLDIFDDESLVKIKYFLLSFATEE